MIVAYSLTRYDFGLGFPSTVAPHNAGPVVLLHALKNGEKPVTEWTVVAFTT